MFFSQRPTPAISATASIGTPGDSAAASVRPAGCARRVMRNGRPHHDAEWQRNSGPECIFLVLFALTIPAANWLIGHVGTACMMPHGPCVVPLRPGLMAPSGVTMVGFALVLRDLVQRRLGTADVGIGDPVRQRASALLAPPRWSLPPASRFCFPNLPILRSIRRWRDGGWLLPSWRRALSGWWSIRSCFCGSLSARSISCRASRRQGLDGAAVDPVRGLAAPPRSRGSASRRHDFRFRRGKR